MYRVLYNPLSSNGKCLKQLAKLEAKFISEKEEFLTEDITKKVNDLDAFVNSLKEDEKIVIVGGDGTLHRFVNFIRPYDIKNTVLLFKGGTGNDFSREFKENLIDVTEYINNLPYFNINDNKEYFLNCTGFGVDGEVCNLVNIGTGNKKGIQYFKNAIKTFTSFKKYDLEVIVDGVRHNFTNVWLATVMNGKYFGGGMKLNPISDRLDDKLELYVVHSMAMARLITIFPTIFVGKHMKYKHYGIHLIEGMSFKLTASLPQVFQTDGEVTENVRMFTLER